MATPIFPLLSIYALPFDREPIWNTDKYATISGREATLGYYTYPRWRWQIAFEALRSDATDLEFQTLASFINMVNGGALLFFFTDPDDNAITNQSLGTGDGATTAFQAVRAMQGTSGYSFVEPVTAFNGTPTLLVNGSSVAIASTTPNGLITASSPPANGATVAWSGSYYWPCRLDNDTNTFTKMFGAVGNVAGSIYEMKKLSFTSVKLL